MSIGVCLVCFVKDVKVFDITGSQLQFTYEKITDCTIQSISHYVCNICRTRLKQLSVLYKHISSYQRSIEDQENEIECQPLVPLTTHVIERASIPYYVDIKQELVITIKREKVEEDFIEINEDSRLKPERTAMKKATCHKSKIKKHATNRVFCCNICNKKYRRSDHLKLHKLIHMDDMPYSCDVCKRKFKRKEHFKDHLKTHTNDKPHKCDVCSKTFRKGSNLRAHKLIHTRERPFSCDVCNKRFNRKSHLTVHQRTHTGNKPYQCQNCNRAFTRSDHLRLHRKVHRHNEDIFTCDVCREAFIYKHHLKVHIMKTH